MEREIIRLKSLSTYREKLGSSNLCVQTAGSSWKKVPQTRSGYPARAEGHREASHIGVDDLASIRSGAYSDTTSSTWSRS